MREGTLVAGRYEIELEAGSGGMGTVYRAKDRTTGGRVAVKVLLRAGHEGDLERLRRESRVLADLAHPGIVGWVGDGVTDDGAAFLAMEWVEGEHLGARLERGPLTVAETMKLAARVADALGAAHARGIVHRDVKPDNLLLPGGAIDRVKVADFGIVRAQQTVLPHNTRSGLVIGTPGYMAPEQARAKKVIDARADVFALGCVLYECLTGVPAYAGEDFVSILVQLVMDDAPRARAKAPHLRPELDDLIARMMKRDPAGRPRDGLAVALQLARIPDPSRAVPLVGHRSSHRLAITLGEQKLVSVVLARRPAESGPEEVGERVADLGVEVLADGSIAGVLEGRGDAIEQASRAARLGLSLRSRLPGWSVAVVFDRAEIGASGTLGRLVDRAVPLLRGPGTVGLDEVAARLLEGRFEVTRAGTRGELKGEREKDGVQSRPGHAIVFPFEGRERELAHVVSTFEACAEERRARALLVLGPAGSGKSRLRNEAIRPIDERALVLQCRGDGRGTAAPFSAAAELVRGLASLQQADPPAARRAKLLAVVERAVPAEDVARVATFLGEVTGISMSKEIAGDVQLRAARADPPLMGDQVRRAFEDLVFYECMVQPVVLVLEDLHTCDAATVQLFEGLLRVCAHAPLLVIAVARPEARERFPQLFAGSRVEVLELEPLGGRVCQRLVREALGDKATEARVAAIVARADGNPFFLEELVRAEGDAPAEGAPAPVLALVQARLEALPAEERRVLRAGAVYGRVFSSAALAAVLGRDRSSEATLDQLVDAGLLSWRRGERAPDDREYSFRQELAHEAAYAMLTPVDRVVAHGLAARWLQEAGEEDAGLIAEHFERAGDEGAAELQWRAAARQRLEANDFAGALQACDRGVKCGAIGPHLGRLRVVQAEAHRWRGDNAAARACGLDALELLRPGVPAWCRAAEQVAAVAVKLGDSDSLNTLVDALLAAEVLPDSQGAAARAIARAVASLIHLGAADRAEALLDLLARKYDAAIAEDVGARAAVGAARAVRALARGDTSEYLKEIEAAHAAYLQGGDRRSACFTAINRGYAYQELGAYEHAEVALREALESARRLGLDSLTAAASHNLGLAVALQGRTEEGRAIEAEALELARTQGDRRLEGASRIYLARIALFREDLAAAESEARRALELFETLPPYRAYALGVLGRTLVRRGAGDEALRVTADASAILRESGPMSEGEAVVRLARCEALAASGARAEAAAEVVAALARLEERAARIREPGLRAAFLTAVPEHARTVELSRAQRGGPP